MTNKQIQNIKQLVETGVATLQTAGWSEGKIVAQLPYLVNKAIKFLTEKTA